MDLIAPYLPVGNLRSSTKGLLTVKKVHYKSVGERSFSFYGPKLWNSLPLNISSNNKFDKFKRDLKTYFFPKRCIVASC